MLNRRIVTGILLALLSILAIFVDWLYVLMVVVLIGAGLYEFFSLIENKGIQMYKYFGIVMGGIIPLSTYFRFELTKGWEFLFTAAALFILFILQFSRRRTDNAVLGISATIFGVLYISWFFTFMIKIKLLPYGTALVGALLLITKGTDIGAFLVGSRWGKTLLIPKISPKKTMEGMLGGLVFSVLGALASRSFLPPLPVFSTWKLVGIGLLLGILAMLGDLSESLIKRDCGMKDSGRVLPGLGGVMDVMDSLLFTAPTFYFLVAFYLSRTFSTGNGF